MTKTKDDTDNKTKLKKESISSKVLSESLQHPMTLYPFGISILGLLYMILISFDKTAFSVTSLSALLSTMSFVFHYVVKGDDKAENIINKEILNRRKGFENQWMELKNRMLKEGFDQGAEQVMELHHAYARLVSFLEEKFRMKANLTAQRFIQLAEESYNRGLTILKKALIVYSALMEMDESKLKNELKNFENELKNFNENSPDSQQTRIALETRIVSHKKRLELFDERNKTLQELMAQCEVLEATLDSTYLEVVDMMNLDPDMEMTETASRLEKAVASARKAENRIRGLKSSTYDKDAIYLDINNE